MARTLRSSLPCWRGISDDFHHGLLGSPRAGSSWPRRAGPQPPGGRRASTSKASTAVSPMRGLACMNVSPTPGATMMGAGLSLKRRSIGRSSVGRPHALWNSAKPGTGQGAEHERDRASGRRGEVFEAEWCDHDRRYEYAAEWLALIRRETRPVYPSGSWRRAGSREAASAVVRAGAAPSRRLSCTGHGVRRAGCRPAATGPSSAIRPRSGSA